MGYSGKQGMKWSGGAAASMCFYLPDSTATIDLFLRRTLVHSVILIIIFEVHQWLQPVMNVEFCSTELQSVEVSKLRGEAAIWKQQ